MESGAGQRGARVNPDAPTIDSNATRTSSGAVEADVTRDPADDDARPAAPMQRRDPARYQIIGEHGRGGLGRVFRAHDRELGRDIAIKELLQRGTGAELRFFREALITARLEHPGIVPVHEAGRWPDGTPFYAMKLVAGRPLKDVIDGARTLEARLALLPHVVAVADAIAYAHDRKIIHRDLKPANVIVGDFGETVVIDWGLAKDLTDEVPDDVAAGPYRTAADAGLTATGAVLGTPAYMAPEQLRGHADERSDLYALGGILFHVLTGASPSPHVQCHAPRDVRAIAERALATDPADRYPDARAFADDLRRYMQHRPIAARRYSVAARAALGFARHRAAALALVGALVAVIAVLAYSLVKIEVQRSQALAARRDADTARSAADTARTAAESAKDELELKHAELLLTVDPTAAADLLSKYHGSDTLTRDRLMAKAQGLGVAVRVGQPHTDEVVFLAELPDHGIASMAGDGTVVASYLDHDISLATDVALIPAFAYSQARHLLVYPHSPRGVMVLDLVTREAFRLDSEVVPVAVAITSDGARVAVAANDGTTSLWDLGSHGMPSLRLRVTIPDVTALVFASREALVARTLSGLARVSRDGISVVVRAPRGTHMAASSGLIVTDAADGVLTWYTGSTLARLRSVPVCASQPTFLGLGSRESDVLVACAEGPVSAWNTETGERVAQMNTAGGAYSVGLDADHRYLCAGGRAKVLYVLDLATGTTKTYYGHSRTIDGVLVRAGGQQNEEQFVTADVSGVLRYWPRPTDNSVVLVRANVDIPHALFAPAGRQIATDGLDGKLRLIDLETLTTKTAQVSDRALYAIRYSPDGKTLITWGLSSTLFALSAQDLSVRARMNAHVGLVQDAVYVDDAEVVSGGSDGMVLSWSWRSGRATPLWSAPVAVFRVERVAKSQDVVIATMDRGIYYITHAGQARELLEPNDAAPTVFKASPDGRWAAIGTALGAVVVVEVSTGRVVASFETVGAVRYIAFAKEDSTLVVSSGGGVVTIRSLTSSPPHSSEFGEMSSYVAVSHDGSIVAIACVNGSVWLYDLQSKSWRFIPPHDATVTSVSFAPDDCTLVSSDTTGVVTVSVGKRSARCIASFDQLQN